MERSEIKPYIAKRVAKELHDGDVVNLGIGLPTMVPDYLDPSVKLTLQSENGFIGLAAVDPEDPDAAYIVNAGGQPAGIEKDGMFFDSATSFSIIRGGHVDATILGSLQVDEKGNIANWIIPGKMVPGMGGAMDLVVGAKRVIVAMEHTQKGAPKILKECTLPLTAEAQVNLIVTEMGVMEVTPEGIVLKEYNPEFTVEEIQAATEAKLIIADDLKPILRRIYQLMLTRIMHQISHIFDLNKIKNNFIFYLKRCAFREGTPFIHFQLTVSDPAFADPYSAHQWHRKTVLFSTLFPFYDVSYTATDIPAPTRNPFQSSAAEFLLFFHL